MSKTLVFIHGSGDSSRVWQPQLTYFPQAHALDLPGHGQRPDSLPLKASVADYARATYAIIRAELELRARPIIAGHSLGGAIALQMALDYGKELDGLILIGTGARLRVHPTLLAQAQQTPELAKGRLTELATTEPTIRQTTLREVSPSDPMSLYRDLVACDAFDVMNRLHEITAPTLIICGADDQLTPVKYSTYLHQHIPGSQLEVIEQAGHYVMREQTEVANRAIEMWLATL